MTARLLAGKPVRSAKQAITFAQPPAADTNEDERLQGNIPPAEDGDATPASAHVTKRRSFPLLIAKVLALVLAFRIFIAAPFSIPSESMMPTLMQGDFLIAAKWPYGWSRQSVPFDLPLIPGRIKPALPERGDVVIFRHPLDNTDYVKRAIGLPGDEVMLRDGRLYLNGVAVQRERMLDGTVTASPGMSCDKAAPIKGNDRCRVTGHRETLPNGRSYVVLDFGRTPQDSFGPVIVPPGKLFVLGDNRDHSADSRFPVAPSGGVGLVEQRQLVARAGLVALSSDGTADWLKPWTWFAAIRGERVGSVL